MDIRNYSYNNNIKQNFTSRNPKIVEAGDILRRTKLVFPVISPDRLKMTSTKPEQADKVKPYKEFFVRYLEMVRDYCRGSESARRGMFKELLAMRKNKVGNCDELSDATLLALKMNGYKDARKLGLYAYNKKKGTVISLDHTVVVTDLNPDEKYVLGKVRRPHKLKPSDLIKSRKLPEDSIIVDTWAGFADYPKNAETIYRTRNWMSGFANKVVEGETPGAAKIKNQGAAEANNKIKLDENYGLAYLVYPDVAFGEKDYQYFRSVFPSLLSTKKSGYHHDVVGISLMNSLLNSSKRKPIDIKNIQGITPVKEEPALHEVKGLSHMEVSGLRMSCLMPRKSYWHIKFKNTLPIPPEDSAVKKFANKFTGRVKGFFTHE